MSTNVASNDTTRLPRAVRAQMQRIDDRRRLESQTNGDEATPPGADANTANNAAADPGANPPAASAADPRENDPAYWRQRFNVTQGMLRTQREQHEREMGERDRQVQELRDKVRALEAATAPKDNELDLSAFFTPEQIEQFGEEQCRAVAQASTKAARQHAQQLIEAEIAPIKEQAKTDAERAQRQARQRFLDALTEKVPDWESINADAKWLAWLDEPDETTGMRRQDILDNHNRANNAVGVAALFTAFQKGTKRPTPPMSPSGDASVGDGAPPPQASAKGYPSREEIRDYYKRKALNKVSKDEQVEFEKRLRLKAAA